MSKRKAERTTRQPPQPSAQPTPTPNHAPSSAGTWLGRNWEGVAAVVAIIVSVLSAVFTYRQAQVAQDTLDRATGRIVPRIEYAAATPYPEDFPPDQLTGFLDLPEKRPFYKDVNAVVLLPPTLHMNNTGTEAIEAIKVETSFLEGFIDSRADKMDIKNPPPNPPPDWYKNDTPVVLRKVEREEHVLSQQWKPGQGIEVSIAKGVLGQMWQVSPFR